MSAKWIGAIFVLFSCGGFGFRIAHAYRQRERLLHQLLNTLETMSSELEYHLTALPVLSRKASADTSGVLRDVFANLARELEWQSEPDAECCMSAAVSASCLTSDTKRLLLGLGRTLGRFDLEGQLKGIDGISREAAAELDRLTKNQDARLRSYQTLGLCAGAALAILLL